MRPLTEPETQTRTLQFPLIVLTRTNPLVVPPLRANALWHYCVYNQS